MGRTECWESTDLNPVGGDFTVVKEQIFCHLFFQMILKTPDFTAVLVQQHRGLHSMEVKGHQRGPFQVFSALFSVSVVCFEPPDAERQRRMIMFPSMSACYQNIS